VIWIDVTFYFSFNKFDLCVCAQMFVPRQVLLTYSINLQTNPHFEDIFVAHVQYLFTNLLHAHVREVEHRSISSQKC
jgi:hypothetical protein